MTKRYGDQVPEIEFKPCSQDPLENEGFTFVRHSMRRLTAPAGPTGDSRDYPEKTKGLVLMRGVRVLAWFRGRQTEWCTNVQRPPWHPGSPILTRLAVGG